MNSNGYQTWNTYFRDITDIFWKIIVKIHTAKSFSTTRNNISLQIYMLLKLKKTLDHSNYLTKTQSPKLKAERYSNAYFFPMLITIKWQIAPQSSVDQYSFCVEKK